MKKLYVTLMFMVDVPDDQDHNAFKTLVAKWCKEDAAGFLLSRPTLEERLPTAVVVVTVPQSIVGTSAYEGK